MTSLKVLGLGRTWPSNKTGLLKLAFTNGSKDQKINFNNTILQLTYNVKF
jgi:hypothetical protein